MRLGLSLVFGFVFIGLTWPLQAQPAAQPIPSAAPKSTAPAARPAPPAKAPETAAPKSPLIEPMVFTRVVAEPSACRETCPEWIAAEGRIVAGQTNAALRRVVNAAGKAKLPIVIASPGGSVEEGYAMARFIRSKGLAVVVARTELLPCPADDKACEKRAREGVRLGRLQQRQVVPCASSCVFVLAGGVQRHVGPTAIVGVHQYQATLTSVRVLERYRIHTNPWTGEKTKEVISTERIPQKTEKAAARPEAYDRSTVFFKEMGINETIMVPLRATPHERMHWLTRQQMDETKIATDYRAAHEVLGLAGPSSQPGGASVGNAVPPSDKLSPSLVRELHTQLRLAGCLPPTQSVPTVLAEPLKIALQRFIRSAAVPLPTDTVSIDSLAQVIKLRTERKVACERTDEWLVRDLRRQLWMAKCLATVTPTAWTPLAEVALRQFAARAELKIANAGEPTFDDLLAVTRARRTRDIECGSAIEPPGLRDLRDQLVAARCLPASADAAWGPWMRDAVVHFAKAAGATLDASNPTADLVDQVAKLRRESTVSCQAKLD